MKHDKILITGVNGFIGTHLKDYFLDLGYKVYGIDIFDNGIKHENFKFFALDLAECGLRKILEEVKPTHFIHCAGNASVPISVENPRLDFNRNVEALYDVLLAIKELTIKPKCIFLSSAAVYGNPKILPINEKDDIYPISPYGLHKKIGEDICRYYREFHDIDIKIVRIFSAYGEGLKKQIFWDMYNKIKSHGKLELFGTGYESRDFIHVNDIMRAIELVMNSEDNEMVYNIASGIEITIRRLAEIFCDEYGIDRNYIRFNGISKIGDPKNWRANITKLTDIGFDIKVNIEDGVRRYIKWVRELE